MSTLAQRSHPRYTTAHCRSSARCWRSAPILILPSMTTDHRHRFTEVGLRVSRRMLQRHEHLALAQLPEPHVVLHNRVAARVAVLIAQPFENPLGRMTGGLRLALGSSSLTANVPSPARVQGQSLWGFGWATWLDMWYPNKAQWCVISIGTRILAADGPHFSEVLSAADSCHH